MTSRLDQLMGVDIGALLQKRPSSMPEYAHKTVAIDAWNILYQFLSSIRQSDGTPLMNAAGEITSHLAGVLYRTASMVEAGIKPVWVFDGEPHPLKQETIAARSARRTQAESDCAEALESGDEEMALSKAKQTSRLTAPMAEQAKQLLRSLGIPVVDAPSEGEAQAAWMAKGKIVDFACSQDFDSLLFGAPQLVRNLTVTGRRKLPGKQVWVDVAPEQIGLQETLAAIELTQEQLIDAALLVGTDFNPGIKGVGPKKAVALIQKYGDLEALVEKLADDPDSADSAVERAVVEQHEALIDRDTIRGIFANPTHTEVADVAPRKPDSDAVRELMVGQFGFSKERVDGALGRFEAARGKADQKGLFDF